MSDEGASFTIDLPVTGTAQVDAAAASVDLLASRLGDSTKAIQAAEAGYSKAESAADRAAKALERVGLAADLEKSKLAAATKVGDQNAVEKITGKLRDLTAQQSVLAERAEKAKVALEGQAKALDKVSVLAERAEKAKVALEGQAKALDKVPKPAEQPKTEAGGEKGEGINFEAVTRGLNKIGGPLAGTLGKVTELGGGFEKLSGAMAGGPYLAVAAGITALVAAVAAFAIGVAVATVKVAAWAVGLADVARTSSLLAQGMARSVAGGELLDGTIDDLTKTLPLTREELTATAQRLADAGLRGQALSNALDKAAIAAAKLKFGPDFAAQMLSLDEQSKVFHENIANIFGGLKIDGLLTALQKLLSIFDTENASGRALKVVFESVFQPLIDGATAAEPKVERFFLQMEVLALKAAIFLKPYASLILDIGKAFLVVAAIIGGVVVAAIGIVVASLAAPIAFFAALVYGVMKFSDGVVFAVTTVKTWLGNLNLADMGKAMIDGLVHGIENGGAAVLAAMKGAVTGAVDAAEKALGIASPSKVFAEIGMQTGAGMAIGVDKSSATVQTSMASMITPPAASVGAGASAVKSSSGASISGNTFILNGVQGADDAVSRIGELFTRLLEGDATQLGAVPAAT